MDRSGSFHEKTRVIREKIAVIGGKCTNWLAKFRPEKSERLPEGAGTDTATPLGRLRHILGTVAKWIYHLRKVLMAIPVVFYALKLAAYCRKNLPEQVGLNLLASGEFAQTVDRSLAVNGSLMITMGCLVLMFFSRRARYPWIISIFSLALPLLLIVTNLYPQ